MADEPPSEGQEPPDPGRDDSRVIFAQVTEPAMTDLKAQLVEKAGQARGRNFLSGTFAAAFLLTLGASFAGSLTKWAPVKDWLQLVLPAETGLFGSALGFYFGSNKG